jgi:hypothetical protein
MVFLVSQFLFVLFGLFGLMVWACSDMPLAIREIALNTRKDRAQGSPYTLVRVLSVCLKILAVLLWVGGIAAIVALNAAGSLFGGLFQAGLGQAAAKL